MVFMYLLLETTGYFKPHLGFQDGKIYPIFKNKCLVIINISNYSLTQSGEKKVILKLISKLTLFEQTQQIDLLHLKNA